MKVEEQKSLIKAKKGFFEKVKNFFLNLFKRKSAEEVNTAIREEYNNFKEYIQIQEDKEKSRILNLQEEFKQGNIDENEIEENDYNKLLKLYDEQNEKLRKEIEMYKVETDKILKQMSNT